MKDIKKSKKNEYDFKEIMGLSGCIFIFLGLSILLLKFIFYWVEESIKNKDYAMAISLPLMIIGIFLIMLFMK